MHKPVKNILAIRLDRIGDLVQTMPAIEAIYQATNLKPTILCHTTTASLFDHNPHVGARLLYDSGGRRLLDQIIIKIKSLKIDWAINFSHEKTSRQVMPKLQFIKNRLGNINSLQAWFCYNRRLYQKRSYSTANEADYCLDMLKKLPYNDIDLNSFSRLRPKIFLLPQEIKNAKSLLHKLANLNNDFIILHPGIGKSALNWPKEKYKKLLALLLKGGFKVMLTGVLSEEKTFNRELKATFSQYGQKLFDASAMFDLRTFCAILKQANLVIAPSTGTLHLAAAVGTAILGLYSPILVQSKTRWAPYKYCGDIITPAIDCPAKYRCQGRRCPHFYCFNSISPESVWQSVCQILPQ